VDTVSRLRPRRRRAAMILRPFLVLLRARYPWVRLRLMLEGWYVRFIALARFLARKSHCAARRCPLTADDRTIGSCRRWVAISSNGSGGCQTPSGQSVALIARLGKSPLFAAPAEPLIRASPPRASRGPIVHSNAPPTALDPKKPLWIPLVWHTAHGRFRPVDHRALKPACQAILRRSKLGNPLHMRPLSQSQEYEQKFPCKIMVLLCSRGKPQISLVTNTLGGIFFPS